MVSNEFFLKGIWSVFAKIKFLGMGFGKKQSTLQSPLGLSPQPKSRLVNPNFFLG